MISIYEPEISNYSNSAIQAIKSGWISNHGEFIEKSTNKLKEILNAKHVILMANGTCATHCLFLSIKYKYPNINKIYIPNNCYVAAWNCCFMEYDKNQIEVMKMDVNTWNICVDEEYIKSLDTNSAVLIVHNLGNIINVPRLKRLRPDLIFVEDNCEGFTGKYEDIYSGTSESSLCSSVSFYGNKIITTGEGGAFFTSDDEVYNYIKKVFSQGMSSIRYLHDTHAFNYRMTNIQAAFLYEQLNDFDKIITNKKRLFEIYKKFFSPMIKNQKIKFFEIENHTEQTNWIFSIRILNNNLLIEDLNKFFNKNNVEIRPFFYPINCHKHLNDIEYNDDVSKQLSKEIIMLPSSPKITREEQMIVVESVFKLLFYYDNIEIIKINKENLELLNDFIPTINSSYFRYYNNRNINSVETQIITVLLKNRNNYIGYGHIDHENNYWIGIYLHNEYRKKGLGKLLLSYLIFISIYKNIENLFLSVDKSNNIAFSLYSKFGFKIFKDNQSNFTMIL